MNKPFNILFICNGNSCRSQMAEGWAKWFGRPLFEIQSAGIESHGKNPRAIAVMKEAGVDISRQESIQLSAAMLEQADLVVTLCGQADEHCPILPPGTRKEHWPLGDPARATGTEQEVMAAYRQSCEDIRVRVRELLERLNANLDEPITTAVSRPPMHAEHSLAE